MSSNINIYGRKKIIRRDASGEITLDISRQLVRELATAAHFYPDHNILVDFRETTISQDTRENLMDIAVECSTLKPFSFDNKIAMIVPNEPDRIESARIFENDMKIKNFKYSFFTDFDRACNWISEG